MAASSHSGHGMSTTVQWQGGGQGLFESPPSQPPLWVSRHGMSQAEQPRHTDPTCPSSPARVVPAGKVLKFPPCEPQSPEFQAGQGGTHAGHRARRIPARARLLQAVPAWSSRNPRPFGGYQLLHPFCGRFWEELGVVSARFEQSLR